MISTPGSAREARTQFETGFGDALITYELEGLVDETSREPRSRLWFRRRRFSVSIRQWWLIEMSPRAKRPVVDAFMQYLWSEEAQRAFVKYHFRSVTNEALNQENKQLATHRDAIYDRLFRRLEQGLSGSHRSSLQGSGAEEEVKSLPIANCRFADCRLPIANAN